MEQRKQHQSTTPAVNFTRKSSFHVIIMNVESVAEESPMATQTDIWKRFVGRHRKLSRLTQTETETVGKVEPSLTFLTISGYLWTKRPVRAIGVAVCVH